ncbi:MAG: hypothetical protein ACYCVG_01580 [Leptospirillum sp.]
MERPPPAGNLPKTGDKTKGQASTGLPVKTFPGYSGYYQHSRQNAPLG